MKPGNWSSMTDSERKTAAMKLYQSKRGWFLMGQALCNAIEAMKQVDEAHREISNIEDMEMLQELFFPYHFLKAFEQSTRDQRGA